MIFLKESEEIFALIDAAILYCENIKTNTSFDDKKDDEFTCTICFLVLRNTQLAKPRSKVCADCV